MIVVKFFDYGAGQIDIEKAMNINIDVIDFLVDKIEELEFECLTYTKKYYNISLD